MIRLTQFTPQTTSVWAFLFTSLLPRFVQTNDIVKLMKNISKYILSAVAVLIVLSAASFAFFEIINKNKKQNPEVAATSLFNFFKNKKGFKLYKNLKYGLQFEYPEDWQYKENQPRKVTYSFRRSNDSKTTFEKGVTDFFVEFGNYNEKLTVRVFEGNIAALESFEYRNGGNIRKSKPIQLRGAGLTGYLIAYKGQIPDAIEKFQFLDVRVERNNKVYRVVLKNYENEKEYEDAFWHIVNSLKFL